MKTLQNKKLILSFIAAVLCISTVRAQLLNYFPGTKFRKTPFTASSPGNISGYKSSVQHGLPDAVYQKKAPCLKKQNTLGGTGYDFGNKLIPTCDGGFIVCGGTNSGDGDFKVPVERGQDAFIARYNHLKQLEWAKTFGGSGDDFFNDIAQTFDGGYIVAGNTSSNDGNVSGNHGILDVWVVKFSASGNIQWQKCLGGSGVELGQAVIQTFYSGYAIGGFTNSNDGDVSGNHNTDGNFDAWLVQLGFTGNLVTQHCYGGSGFDNFTAIVRSDFGSLILQGATQSNDGDVSGNHGSQDAWVVKTNLSGKITWQRTVGGSADEGLSNNIAKTTDGNIVIDGYSFSNDGDINGKDTLVSFITKLNSSTGNIIWSRSYYKPGERGGFGIFATSDGGIVETGAFGAINVFPIFDVLISKFDANGKEEWYKVLGGSDFDEAIGGYETPNGNLNILCLTASPDGDIKNNHGGIDTWLIKLGHCGDNLDLNDDAVSADKAITSTKNNTIHLSNYPNPVSNSTTISFSLPQSQKVSIQIFDMNGRIVKTLADTQMQQGAHQLTWNTKDEKGNALNAGIYFLKMEAGNYIETKKISIVK